MASSLELLQDNIIAELTNNLAQKVYEEGIPNSGTVKRNSTGQVEPYLTIQFGDMFAAGARSMVGARGHDYVMPLAIQVMSPNPGMGRKINNKVISIILGKQFPYAGEIEKRPVGGAIVPITEADASAEVYMVPSWYKVGFQYFANVP